MKRTLSVSISGTVFQIEDNAYKLIEEYLGKLEKYFSVQEGGNEVLADIEFRIAEILKERNGREKEVVILSDIEFVIEQLGSPEEFMEPEEIGGKSREKEKTSTSERKLYRDIDHQFIAGICSGLAKYLNLDRVLVRILWILFTIMTSGFFILVYLIMWAIVSPAHTSSQKLEMQGEPVNVKNIRKEVNEKTTRPHERRSSGFGRFLGIILKTLGIIILIIIGLPLIIALIAIIIALIAAVVGVIAFADMIPFTQHSLEILRTDSFSHNGMYLMGFVIVMSIIFFTSKIMFKHKGKSGWFIFIMSILFIIGFAMSLKSGGKIIRELGENFENNIDYSMNFKEMQSTNGIKIKKYSTDNEISSLSASDTLIIYIPDFEELKSDEISAIDKRTYFFLTSGDNKLKIKQTIKNKELTSISMSEINHLILNTHFKNRSLEFERNGTNSFSEELLENIDSLNVTIQIPNNKPFRLKGKLEKLEKIRFSENTEYNGEIDKAILMMTDKGVKIVK